MEKGADMKTRTDMKKGTARSAVEKRCRVLASAFDGLL